jgi:hypothetical protein
MCIDSITRLSHADSVRFVSAGVRRSHVGSVNNRATPIVAFGKA